jgi:hypothetical protein
MTYHYQDLSIVPDTTTSESECLASRSLTSYIDRSVGPGRTRSSRYAWANVKNLFFPFRLCWLCIHIPQCYRASFVQRADSLSSLAKAGPVFPLFDLWSVLWSRLLTEVSWNMPFPYQSSVADRTRTNLGKNTVGVVAREFNQLCPASFKLQTSRLF